VRLRVCVSSGNLDSPTRDVIEQYVSISRPLNATLDAAMAETRKEKSMGCLETSRKGEGGGKSSDSGRTGLIEFYGNAARVYFYIFFRGGKGNP